MPYYQFPDGSVYEFNHTPSGSDAKRLTNAEGKRLRKEYARRELASLVEPGATVYCVLRSVSSSGMSRRISLFVIRDGELRNLDSLAADAIDYRLSPKEGIIVGGCGMDMGFHLVHTLSYAIHGSTGAKAGYTLKHSWV